MAELVQLVTAVQKTGNESFDVLLSVRPPDSYPGKPTQRQFCDICLVIDVSGSMCAAAELKTDDKEGSHGFTQLNIVQHAVKTIVSSLSEQDCVSVVKFSSSGEVVLPFTPMSASKQQQIIKKVDAMSPSGGTNLWDGLLKALELFNKLPPSTSRARSIFLLTDGCAGPSPPQGEVVAFRIFKDQFPNNKTQVHTFGFGYDADSSLLRTLAAEGNGSFAFIPDCSFVGTIFVNALANQLVTISQHTILSLEPVSGVTIADKGVLACGEKVQRASWGVSVPLNSLQFGQSRDVVVQVTVPQDFSSSTLLTATLKVLDAEKSLDVPSSPSTDPALQDQLLVQKNRLLAVETLRNLHVLTNDRKEQQAANELKALEEAIKGSSVASDPFIQALLADLQGQVTEAISRNDWFRRWGRHYLPSLTEAHMMQQCNNFKDPGVQGYGSGSLFNHVRDQLDKIFVSLPPPKPSRATSKTQAPATMAGYYSSSAPCFAGQGRVLMADGSLKLVMLLTKGDRVAAPGGRSASVACVLRTVIPGGRTPLVRLPESGLLITPYHPVREAGRWAFPCDLAPAVERPCDAVYSFVLDSEHVMLINGVECVSLGHGFQEPVVKHAYFGSEQVLRDLRRCSTWESGLVSFDKLPMLHDSATGEVNGMLIC